MKRSNAIELGLTIPLQRHLHLKALPDPQEPDRHFCWDLHVIPLRGRFSLLAVHCHTRYTFVLYDLNRLEWERLPDVFLDGLRLSLSAAGFPAEAMKELCGSELPLFTRTHGRREVAFLNRAWEDVIAAELALDESSQSQPLLEQIINAKPSRCAGAEGLGMAAERLADMAFPNLKGGASMRIIIAPAKKMVVDTDSFAVDGLPQFLERTERLKAVLQGMSPKDLQTLWKCNDAIAKLNVDRLEQMDLRRNLTPAILSYEGIQYRYMAPGVMETTHLDYLREHLRILSGFYGLLRPFDGVVPYRLEMQTKLAVDGCRDLYQFWGSRLARQLASETDVVLNLASREYSRAVEAYLPKTVRFVTCAFGELKDGKVVEKGTKCKMARGQMVRWLAENQIKDPEDIRAFNQLGYQFCRSASVENHTVFLWIQSPKD